MYGAVAYAKDGLLPLLERPGLGPWLDRLEDLAQTMNRTAPVRTPFGTVPAEEPEVNGQALQILSRLCWATGDDQYRATAQRARHRLDRWIHDVRRPVWLPAPRLQAGPPGISDWGAPRLFAVCVPERGARRRPGVAAPAAGW